MKQLLWHLYWLLLCWLALGTCVNVSALVRKYMIGTTVLLTQVNVASGTGDFQQHHLQCVPWPTKNICLANLWSRVYNWLTGDYTDVEIKWYRSRNEHTAGIEGDNIQSDTGEFIQQQININNTIITSILYITHFNVNDRGYYWCQIVVNSVSLSPSPHGYI